MLFILGLVLLIYIICVTNKSEDGGVLRFIGIIIILFLYFLGWLICTTNPNYKLKHESYPIASIRTSNNISGSFTLGSGYIKSEEYYYFMFDNGNDSYTRGWVVTDGTIIQETNNQSPTFEYDVFCYRNRWVVPWDITTYPERCNYKLIVPPNTVIKKFSIE